MHPTTTYEQFETLDLRVGTIIEARAFPKAHRPAYQLRIDFGTDIGIRQSSAQITTHYTLENLIGQQVIAIVNFPPKQIADFLSEVLVLGAPDSAGHIRLLTVDANLPNGSRVY